MKNFELMALPYAPEALMNGGVPSTQGQDPGLRYIALTGHNDPNGVQ